MIEYENVRKRQNAAKFAHMIITQFLSEYIPTACAHDAMRHLEFRLLENDLYIMDDHTKALLKNYEDTALKVSGLIKYDVKKVD